mmetsp:Transcript_15976/g.29902  ORF Transcript_15976/g.29902 Transcript_15976/m.29902 type:complete len:434 (-) Transcript_15976:89-1390(-)|eukprot:CAMPEP_0182503546 /NCGR_PEP_ID=MMETSP1321-20130603/15509_1 /TAXON_ID=91990 /ORGANISM="Bolidomonas sp., Strain RCC1657" /LENGTH=433 /DNA_ID=CAMNT_0024708731 /DNA_START=514 /DNA_END=1815 /DNA_ORIENTATION=+
MSHLNQTGRFDNVSALIEYVCTQPRPLSTDYVPVCPFPYVNRGWLGSLEGDDFEGAQALQLKESDLYDISMFDTDVVFDDCSMNMSEALGSKYAMKCGMYLLMSLIPTVLSCSFLRTMYLTKLAKNKGKGKKQALNMSEKMCILNIFIGFFTCILMIDIDSYNGFMNLEYWRPIFLGLVGGSMYHIMVMLVTNWVGIIDAAMSKKKPAWSENFGLFTIVSCYLVEIVFGYLEFHVGPSSHLEAASNGNMRAFKYLYTSLLVLIWTAIGVRYGLKLSATLKSGAKDGPNPQLRKIQKYIFALALGSSLGAMQKLVVTPKFLGKDLFRNLPVCSLKGFYMGPTTTFYILTLIIQWSIVYAQQPGKKTVRSGVTSAFSKMSTAVSGRSRRGSVTPSMMQMTSSTSERSTRKSSVSSSTGVSGLSSTSSVAPGEEEA